MKATAAASAVNPTIAIQQTLPQIAKASTIVWGEALYRNTIFEPLLNGLKDFRTAEDDRLNDAIDGIFKDDNNRNSNSSDYIYQCTDAIWNYDMAMSLSDRELKTLYTHALANVEDILSEDAEEEDAKDDLNILTDLMSVDDIRHRLRVVKDDYIELHRNYLQRAKNPRTIMKSWRTFKKEPEKIMLQVALLGLEDQLRLWTYYQHADYEMPISKSMKSGIVSLVFDQLKQSSKFSDTRLRTLDYVVSERNEITNTCPDFVGCYVIGKPYTLREIKEIYDSQKLGKLWARMDSKFDLENLLKFYGLNPDNLINSEELIITIDEEKKSVFSNDRTFIFELAINGLKPKCFAHNNDSHTQTAHDLRHAIFEILGEKIFHEDIYVSQVGKYHPSIRVTVPANTEISEFMDMWMAEQNPYD